MSGYPDSVRVCPGQVSGSESSMNKGNSYVADLTRTRTMGHPDKPGPPVGGPGVCPGPAGCPGGACPGCPGRALWAQKSVWEIRVPTLEESLFVVPDHEAGLRLFQAGVPRGRIWCRCRLLDLLAAGGASDFPAIAAVTAAFDGGLDEVTTW